MQPGSVYRGTVRDSAKGLREQEEERGGAEQGSVAKDTTDKP